MNWLVEIHMVSTSVAVALAAKIHPSRRRGLVLLGPHGNARETRRFWNRNIPQRTRGNDPKLCPFCFGLPAHCVNKTFALPGELLVEWADIYKSNLNHEQKVSL